MDITRDNGSVVADINGCYPMSVTATDALRLGSTSAGGLYDQSGVDALNQPENCFRVTAGYFEDYSVTLTPSVGFSWSRNSWPEFKGLTCAGTTFAAADQVDVCEMLEEEVALMDEGSASVIPVVNNGGVETEADQIKLTGFDLTLPIDRTRWATLMYYDSTTSAGSDMEDLYDGAHQLSLIHI